jgi:hypothetical protein
MIKMNVWEGFWRKHNIFDDDMVMEVINKINIVKGSYIADLGSVQVGLLYL